MTVICRGQHLAAGQFSHDPEEMSKHALGNGEVGLRCPACGTTVEVDR